MENLEHLITRSIKSYYKNRLYAPIIYLILLVLLSLVYPVWHMILPKTYNTNEENFSLSEMYGDGEIYARFNLNELYFTGYTNKWLDNTTGYYYYTMVGSECVVVLLNPNECDQGEPNIESISIKGKILYDSNGSRMLLRNLADDLSWNEDGILSSVSSYSISQPDATNASSIFMEILFIASGLFALINGALCGLFVKFPQLSPPVQRLRAYGKPLEILDQAEDELATLPQLATEDMFITEHYFIETSNYGVAIVPIDAIIWIYKYSTMHKFLWHHFAISYTLHITAGKRHYIKCPKNIKSDIDGIIDYLSEANHDILVGFSEENRLKVEEIQNDFVLLRKASDILSKRV